MKLTILKVGQNMKLGKGVATWSRPVGPSCPNSCPFLHTACYAERMQNFRPNVKASWNRQGGHREAVYWREWARALRAELEYVAGKGIAVRGHVAGDFMLNGVDLDRPYLAAVLWALWRANPRPAVWFYSHGWRELETHRKALGRLVAGLFASVHSEEEGAAARAAGWRLAIDPGLPVKQGRGGPAWSTFAEGPALMCPEQRAGAEVITCDKCRFCFRPERTESVIFFRH